MSINKFQFDIIDSNPKNWLLLTHVFSDVMFESLICKELVKVKKKAIFVDGSVYHHQDDFIRWDKAEIKTIKNQMQNIKVHFQKGLDWAAAQSSNDPQKLSIQNLISWFNRFEKTFSRAYRLIEEPLLFEKIVKEKIAAELPSGQTPDAFFTPCQKSHTQKMMEEIGKVSQKKNIDYHQEAQKLVKKYFWLGQSFLNGQLLTEKDFIQKIKQAGQRKKIKPTLGGMIKYRSPWQKLAGEVSFIRNWRIETLNHAFALIRPYLEEMARRLGLKYADFLTFTPLEVKQALAGHKISTKQIFQRKKGFAVILDRQERIKLVVGRQLRTLKNLFAPEEKKAASQKLTGVPAQPGKVKGKAIIINSRDDFAKVKSGAIVVAKMTTPNFISILSKAGGLVTDIGGLTSHAAIISRELGIPCVIDTKIATKIVNNGDWVEVDANKGIIKKLN